MDGSSYVKDRVGYVRAAVVSQTEEFKWAQALTRASSAQKAELIALTQTLPIGNDKAVNFYTDSRYASPPSTSTGRSTKTEVS